jgi:hypothetical protein
MVFVIDPLRKGCDEAFARQPLTFRPQTIVYVIYSVHMQARDIGQIISWSAEEAAQGHTIYNMVLLYFSVIMMTSNERMCIIIIVKSDNYMCKQ